MYAWILSNLITPISQDGQFCSYYELLLKATIYIYRNLSTNRNLKNRESSVSSVLRTPTSATSTSLASISYIYIYIYIYIIYI